MQFLDKLNDGAADTFNNRSQRDFDLVQENFKPAAATLGLPNHLFECFPYMKRRFKERMSEFFDMVTPKPKDILVGKAKKYPIVHVDAAKHLKLFMKYPSVQACVKARDAGSAW